MLTNGTDIVEIDRVQEAIDRFGERFLKRVYTDAELARYREKTESLAARFAGKEAVMKTLGRGMWTIPWRDIEILPGPHGKPQVRLYGKAAGFAAGAGISEVAISLAHCQTYAIASAVAEAKGGTITG